MQSWTEYNSSAWIFLQTESWVVPMLGCVCTAPGSSLTLGLLQPLVFIYCSTFTFCCCCGQINRGSSFSVSSIRLLTLSNLQVLRGCWENPVQMEVKCGQRAACKREQSCWDKTLWIIQTLLLRATAEQHTAYTHSLTPHTICFFPAVTSLYLHNNQTFFSSSHPSVFSLFCEKYSGGDFQETRNCWH